MSQINRVIEDIGDTNLICQNKTPFSSNPINSDPIRAGLLVSYNGQLYASHDIGENGAHVFRWVKLGNSITTYSKMCYYADGSKFNGAVTSSRGYFNLPNIENGNFSLSLNIDDYDRIGDDHWSFRDDSRVSNDNNNGVTLLAGYILNPFYESDDTKSYKKGNKIIVNPPVNSSIAFDINVVSQTGGYVDGNVKVYNCGWAWNENNNIPYISRGELIISEPSYQGVRGTLSAGTIRYLCIDYTPNRYEENADGDQFFYHYVRIVQLPSDLEMSDTFTITLNIDDPNDWHSEFYDWIKPDWSGSDECPWDDSVISGIA